MPQAPSTFTRPGQRGANAPRPAQRGANAQQGSNAQHAVPKPVGWVNGPFTPMSRVIQKVTDERADAVLDIPDLVAG
eukprot:jgi/Tetstr1/424001/TSEL_014612.t1